jgi:hypothetical protein
MGMRGLLLDFDADGSQEMTSYSGTFGYVFALDIFMCSYCANFEEGW